MSELTFWPRLILAALATWRVTHLLAREDGPGAVLARFRARLGQSFAGTLMDCFQCLSFWVAAPFAFFVASKPLDLLVAWLALTGAACLLERTREEPVLIQPLPPATEGEEDHGMLRSKQGSVSDESRAGGDARDESTPHP